MQQHFRFLAKHRKVLKLKVNAAEDLLLNGARKPERRGVCTHLLGKVDRVCVESAVGRLPDPAARTNLLKGIVRFSTDVAITIMYLEAVAASTGRAEAARAVAEGLQCIDFSDVSSSQMKRLLELLARLFEDTERASLMIGLLRNPQFRDAVDVSMAHLPDPLARLVEPMRQVSEALAANRVDTASTALAEGIGLVLRGGGELLQGYPDEARSRLLLLAAQLCESNAGVERALDTLLRRFAPTSRAYSTVAMAMAARHMRFHQDAAAVRMLEEVQAHHPRFALPGRWIAALKAPRVGRIAVLDPNAVDASDGRLLQQPLPGLYSAICLDRQRPAWIALMPGIDAEIALEQASLHGRLNLPSIAPLWAAGRTNDGLAYRAVPKLGALADVALRRRRLTVHDALRLAWEGVCIVCALRSRSVVIPDLALRRFLLDDRGRLWLADLSGACIENGQRAAEQCAEASVLWVNGILQRIAREDTYALAPALMRCLCAKPELDELASALSTTIA